MGQGRRGICAEAPTISAGKENGRLVLTPITIPPADHGDSRANRDLELAAALLRRDRKATALFVDQFSGPIYQYVRSRLMPRTDAVEDVVQDVFIAAWQYLPGYRGQSPLASWLMGIARHKVEDHYRRRLRQWESWEDGSPEPADQSAPPADLVIDRKRMSEKAQRVLGELPEHYAAVLLWRYWEQRPAKEIAAATGRTEKAVERLLARARENFKRRWESNA